MKKLLVSSLVLVSSVAFAEVDPAPKNHSFIPFVSVNQLKMGMFKSNTLQSGVGYAYRDLYMAGIKTSVDTTLVGIGRNIAGSFNWDLSYWMPLTNDISYYPVVGISSIGTQLPLLHGDVEVIHARITANAGLGIYKKCGEYGFGVKGTVGKDIANIITVENIHKETRTFNGDKEASFCITPYINVLEWSKGTVAIEPSYTREFGGGWSQKTLSLTAAFHF